MTEKRKKAVNEIVLDLFVNGFDEIDLSRKIFNNVLIENNIEIYDYNSYCNLFKRTVNEIMDSGDNLNITSPSDLLSEMLKNVYKEKIIK